jgi:SWI/SNF-related matrix-associated actin-dependent regulator of chromatin subfamily A member 2/4
VASGDEASSSMLKKRKAMPKATGSLLVTQEIQKIYDVLMSYEDMDGHIVTKDFVQLPSRKDLPDYYRVIRRPLDLKRLEKYIKEGKYHSIKDFDKDVKLMCKNAQVYNVEGSDIFEDSLIIQELFNEALRQLSLGETDIFIEPGSIVAAKYRSDAAASSGVE